MKCLYETPKIERIYDLINLGLKVTAQADTEYAWMFNIGIDDDDGETDWCIGHTPR